MKVEKQTYQNRMNLFQRVCGERGFRVTPQRLETYSELARSVDHPSAETIHKRVRKRLPMVTLDTVYRTLGKLEELGLAIQVSVVASTMRFEANTDHHHHFVCRKCGAILDLSSPKLDRLRFAHVLPEGYKADWAQVELRGLCPKCSGS